MRVLYVALVLSATIHAIIVAWLPALPQTKLDIAPSVLQIELAPESDIASPRLPAIAPSSVYSSKPHSALQRRVSSRTASAVPNLTTPALPLERATTPIDTNSVAQMPSQQVSAASSALASTEPPASATSVLPKMRYQPPGFGAAYLENPQPDYPPLARRMRLTGTVLLRVKVGVDGHPMEVTLQHSAGSDVLDQAALDAVRRWRFVPARQGDVPISAWVEVPIRFRLDN